MPTARRHPHNVYSTSDSGWPERILLRDHLPTQRSSCVYDVGRTIVDIRAFPWLTEGRAFFVWRRGGQPWGRGETVVAAPVDEKRLGRNRDPDTALWGLNRGGCRGGRGIRLCGERHGSWCGRSPSVPVAMCGTRTPQGRSSGRVRMVGDTRRPLTPRALHDPDRASRPRAGHEVSGGAAGHAHPRNHESVTIMCPSAQTGQRRNDTPVRDS